MMNMIEAVGKQSEHRFRLDVCKQYANASKNGTRKKQLPPMKADSEIEQKVIAKA